MAGLFFGGKFFGGGFFGNLPSAGGIPHGFLGKDVPSWKESLKAVHEQRELERKLAQAKKEVRQVDNKIRQAEKKVTQAPTIKARPQGILANLHRLEVRRDALQVKIQDYEQQLLDLEPLITASRRSKEIDDDDEDDAESMLLL